MKKIVSNLTPLMSMAILCLVAFVSIRSCVQKPDIRYNTERITEIRQDSARHWQDEQDRNHGTVRLAEADAATLRAVYPLLDSVLRTLNIQGKQLQALTDVSTTTAGVIRPHVDTVFIKDKGYPHFAYADNWLKLDGILADSPLIRYSTFDSFVVTTYTKRKWFLGKKETFLDAYSLNPAAHVSGLLGLKVAAERPKRFGIGPYIGYGYNGHAWQPSIGLSLQYSILKF